MHRDYPELLADVDLVSERLVVNDRVLVEDAPDSHAGIPKNAALAAGVADTGGALLLRQSLCTDVKDHPVRGRPAYNACEDCCGAVLQRADGISLRNIHQRVCARTDLRDAGDNVEMIHKRRRGTVADNGVGHTVGLGCV